MEISQEEYTRLTRRPTGLTKALVTLCVVALTFVAIYVYGPQLKARLGKLDPTIIIATAQVANPTAPRVFATSLPRQDTAPAVVPVQQQIDAYNATAQAQFDAAVQAPIENVGQTGADAPVFSKPVERQPAGDNVPTALPIEPQAQADDGHGSKSKPVNIQETRTCLHGQVWIDGRGCKNPTAVALP